GLFRDRRELALEVSPEIRNVEHETRTLVRLTLNGQAGELLKSLEYLSIAPDKPLELGTLLTLGYDRHHRAVVFDIEIQIATEINNVKQFLEIIGSKLALLLEGLDPVGLSNLLGILPALLFELASLLLGFLLLDDRIAGD